jgi:hypothetical protein
MGGCNTTYKASVGSTKPTVITNSRSMEETDYRHPPGAYVYVRVLLLLIAVMCKSKENENDVFIYSESV